jgi:uncharacterized OB-fold protein
MLTFLAQTAAPSADIGTYIQGLFQQALGIDVMLAFRLLAFWTFIIWLVFALWVAIDASARYKQWHVAMLWFLFVLPFNILGFIGYLFMRPNVTLDEHQWTKLESKYLMHELSSVNDCPTCGTLVPVTQNYCAVCGTQMNLNCPKCEALQSIYHVYCSNCGQRLGEDAKMESTLKVVSYKPNLLQKLGEAVLSARTSFINAANAQREKVKAKKVAKQAQRAERETHRLEKLDEKKKASTDKKKK